MDPWEASYEAAQHPNQQPRHDWKEKMCERESPTLQPEKNILYMPGWHVNVEILINRVEL